MAPPTIPSVPRIPPRSPPAQAPGEEILDQIPLRLRSQAAGALGDPDGTHFLSDPSLSTPDKLILLMAVVVQEKEREIETHVERIQGLSEGEEESEGNLLVETMKLQRKIDTLEKFEAIIRGLIEKLGRIDDDAARSIAR